MFYCLLFLFDKYNSKSFDGDILPEYEIFLEKLAAKYFCDVYLVDDKLNNINVPKPGSFDDTILVNNRLNLDIYNNNNTFVLLGTAKSPIRYGFGSSVYYDAAGNIVE